MKRIITMSFLSMLVSGTAFGMDNLKDGQQKKFAILRAAPTVSVLINDGRNILLEGEQAHDMRQALCDTISSLYLDESDGSVQITNLLPVILKITPQPTAPAAIPWHHGAIGTALKLGTGAVVTYLLLKHKSNTE